MAEEHSETKCSELRSLLGKLDKLIAEEQESSKEYFNLSDKLRKEGIDSSIAPGLLDISSQENEHHWKLKEMRDVVKSDIEKCGESATFKRSSWDSIWEKT